MRIILFVFLAMSFSFANCAPLVEPRDIEAEAKHALMPEAVYIACSDKSFEISLERFPTDIKAALSDFPLTAEGGVRSTKCTTQGHTIEASFAATGTGGMGMCGAANFVKFSISIDGKKIINSSFADYCTTWGFSAIKISSYTNDDLYETTVCGYWSSDYKFEKDIITAYTYNCSTFETKEILAKNTRIQNGPDYLNPSQ